MPEITTPKQHILNDKKMRDLESLLLVFPASELKQFYADHSQEMLLTTSSDIERNNALKELLAILSQN